MTTQDKQEDPLYIGHRERLRNRFLVDDGASMPDYELLELLLTMAIPRRDVKPLAKKLIRRFGNLADVVHAPSHKLQDAGLSSNSIVLLRLVHACCLRCSFDELRESDEPIFSMWMQFQDYCREKMAYKEVEEFRVFFLDSSWRLKGEKVVTTGTINKTNVHPREIIRLAIENKAVYVVLAHNHPSGNTKPSNADVEFTKNLEELLIVMDVKLFDHIIVGKNSFYSFRDKGLIKADKYKTKEEKEEERLKSLYRFYEE